MEFLEIICNSFGIQMNISQILFLERKFNQILYENNVEFKINPQK